MRMRMRRMRYTGRTGHAWRATVLAAVTLTVFLAAGAAGFAELAGAEGVGARALGMGDAYVAVADDETAVYWNPAGITDIQHFSVVPAVTVSTDKWTDFKDAADAIQKGQTPPPITNRQADVSALAGIVTSRFAVSELVTTATKLSLNGEDVALSGGGLTATVITVAVPFRTPFVDLGTIAVGANVKFIQAYSGDVAYNFTTKAFAGSPMSQGSGLGFDLGVLARLSRLVQVGLTVRDAYTTVAGIQLPQQIDGGVAVKAPFVGTRFAASLQGYRPQSNTYDSIHVGAEQSLLGLVNVRAGAYANKELGTLGSIWYTAGAGLSVGPAVVDLAVASDDLLASRAKVAVSAGLRF